LSAGRHTGAPLRRRSDIDVVDPRC
jgi:hypothetical protein